MTTIYLIRHAEAEGNLYRIAQGQYDSNITDRGYRQIRALEERFREIPVDSVYSSDLYRTCVTAGAIYLPKHLPLHKRQDLREICVGDWEGKTWGEIARNESEQMINFSKHLERWHVQGAETPEQVRDRVLAAIREIAAENDGKTVAVFSHGCAIRILLATVQGDSIAQIGETPHGDNTAVSLIEAEGDRLRVVYRDDSSHVRRNLSTFARQSWWKRPNALEPGLYFRPIRLPEQTDWIKDCVRAAWADSADSRPLDDALLLKEMLSRPTMVAELEDKPIGLLQLNPEKEADAARGWISLYCMDRDSRTKGYGIQLLGQAVQYYRPVGRNTLCLALAEGNETALRFFTDYGFRPTEERSHGGRQVWEKEIGFHPL